MNHMKTVQVEASISFPSLWRSRILSEQSKEKLEASQGIARDDAIIVGRHVSPLRGKGWVIHNWGLVRTCVWILRDINWNEFWSIFAISFYPYNYYNELYMFDESVDVPMRNCCEIDVKLWAWYLIVNKCVCLTLNVTTLFFSLDFILRLMKLVLDGIANWVWEENGLQIGKAYGMNSTIQPKQEMKS